MSGRDNIPISQEILELLLIPSTATLTSVLNKKGLWNTFMHGVAPLKPGMKMVGPAFTMRYIPAREDLDRTGAVDNLKDVQRIGIEQIQPGEVLVIDARGIAGRGPWARSWLPGYTCGARPGSLAMAHTGIVRPSRRLGCRPMQRL